MLKCRRGTLAVQVALPAGRCNNGLRALQEGSVRLLPTGMETEQGVMLVLPITSLPADIQEAIFTWVCACCAPPRA